MNYQRNIVLSACLFALAACAGNSPRPDAAMAKAEASIDAAEKAGARQYGASDLDTARRKLNDARNLAEEGDDEEALRLAEQAAVDAELAGAKGLRGKSSDALAQLRDSTQTLQEETNRRGPSSPEAQP